MENDSNKEELGHLIPVFGRLRKEVWELKACLVYLASLRLVLVITRPYEGEEEEVRYR